MQVAYLTKKRRLKFHTADLFYFPEVYKLHLFWFRFVCRFLKLRMHICL